jgi:hypothetical protein
MNHGIGTTFDYVEVMNHSQHDTLHEDESIYELNSDFLSIAMRSSSFGRKESPYSCSCRHWEQRRSDPCISLKQSRPARKARSNRRFKCKPRAGLHFSSGDLRICENTCPRNTLFSLLLPTEPSSLPVSSLGSAMPRLQQGGTKGLDMFLELPVLLQHDDDMECFPSSTQNELWGEYTLPSESSPESPSVGTRKGTLSNHNKDLRPCHHQIKLRRTTRILKRSMAFGSMQCFLD